MKGRKRLARTLEMPERTVSRRLRELKNKGYIRLVPQTRGKPTKIVLTRRAYIGGAPGFVKL